MPGVLGHLKNLQLPFLRRLKSLDPSLHFTHELLRPRTLWWAQARDRDPLPAALAHSEGAHAMGWKVWGREEQARAPLSQQLLSYVAPVAPSTQDWWL